MALGTRDLRLAHAGQCKGFLLSLAGLGTKTERTIFGVVCRERRDKKVVDESGFC